MNKKILFLLGSANLSGGTYVILQHAQYLQKQGYQVTVALVFMTINELTELKNSSLCWHPAINELNFIAIDDAAQDTYNIAIFTWWATLFSFSKLRADAYIYFVQSIESRFYPSEQSFIRMLVNKTYQLGLPVITEATWIKDYLQHHYQTEAMLVRNGIIKSVYTTLGSAIAERSNQQLRILVEGPLEASFKNVSRTIELCKQANVGEIWLLTSSAIENYPGVAKVFSKIAIEKVPEVYRSCDVLVKLSYVEGMFGPPLEMFHCGGTAIVYNVSGYDEYIQHNVNALVAKTDDEQAVVQYLKRLQQDREFLARLCEGAEETASRWLNWQQSSDGFAKSLEKLCQRPLTITEKKLLSANVDQYLLAHIDVVVLKNNAPEMLTLTASPLYESGHYILSIPIIEGNNQFAILFGKLYKKLVISSFEIYSDTGSQIQVRVAMNLKQMTIEGDNVYYCQAETAAILVSATMQYGTQSSNANYFFRIKFAPISIREAVQEHAVDYGSLSS